MTREQTAIAVPLLNSYAHNYLGLSPNRVVVAGAHGLDGWRLLVAIENGVQEAKDFDAAKQLIDEVQP